MKSYKIGETVSEQKGMMLTQEEAMDFLNTKKRVSFLEQQCADYEKISASNALKEQRNRGRVEGFFGGLATAGAALVLTGAISGRNSVSPEE